jgi:D-alanyl-D-alanine carboxypeptidase (penicillin-binding protein 5/6)
VLYEQNADEKLPPASITKIMSLLLFMEALDSGKMKLTDTITCSDTAAGYGGSQIWLKPGEEMAVNDLLKAAAIASANDATVCLAEHLAGSEAAFVVEMNRKAKELGMTNTTFQCAAGLDTPGHITTARDVAIMSRELMKHPQIRAYSTVWMDSLRDGATQLVNTNRLIRFYQGATGLKTGTTAGAGSCLSATAERDGLALIAVIMGADTSDHRFSSARALLDWGFANYVSTELKPPALTESIPVSHGLKPAVPLTCDAPGRIVLERGMEGKITQEVELEESLIAPVEKGSRVGMITVRADGAFLTEYPVLAAETIGRMTFWKAAERLFQQAADLGG